MVLERNKSGWCAIASPENVKSGEMLKFKKKDDGNFLLLFCICRPGLNCMKDVGEGNEEEILECPKAVEGDASKCFETCESVAARSLSH